MSSAQPVPIRPAQASARINGTRRDLVFDPRAAAADVLRDDLDLTGTKIVCSAGVCGACTVLIDGQPATSCTVPACAMDGADLRTIEDMDRDGLHPVQKAFLVHDGLQCGYCTPGFIVEAIAFFDRWRAHKGTTEPPCEAISYALAGHLCRCGAYVGIYDAVAAACRGDFDADRPISHPRHDGEAKVTGRARYTTDIRYDDMLVAAYLGSAHAHAAITTMSFERAEAIDGVAAVIDVLTDPHRVARYLGQPIAAVAAVDAATAHRALDAIDVSYEPRQFVIDPDEAVNEGSPVVFGESKRAPANASEGPIPPGRWDGNLRTPSLNKVLSRRRRRARRNLVKARSGAEGLVVVEGTYRTDGQTHTPLEPHGCVATWNGDHLTVHTSTQSVHQLMKELAKHYKLSHHKITVRAEYVGGAFGAKQGLQLEHTTAADLARRTGNPVRLVHDREHELVAGGYRPFTRVELSAVTDADLRPLGLTARSYGSAGIAVQSQVAPWIRVTYGGPKDVQDFDVMTNTGPGRPMRAPSGPPAFWALETLMDEVAHRTGCDPIELRRRWDASDVRQHLYDWAESIPVWQNRQPPGSGSGRFRSGVGVAIGNWFTAFDNTTRVQLDATADGVVARCAVQDMGNGARTVIAAGVAETLGVSPHDIDVEMGNSASPSGPNSSASRTTASVYPTSIDAAKMLQQKLVQSAKRAGLAKAHWTPGGVQHTGGFVALADLLRDLPEPIRVTSHRRGGNSAVDLLGAMPSGSMGLSLFPRMTGAVAVVAADVDTRLGRVHPQHVWLGVAAGKIVSEELARSQCYGAVVQGLGMALTEERHYDPNRGHLLSANLEDYRIPGIGDVPPIDVVFDQAGFEAIKGMACGLSELAALPTPAALGNAVFNATGWRPRQLPFVPRRVQEHVSHLAG